MNEALKVLVCGGRDFADRRFAFEALDALLEVHGSLHVIQGGAEGADALAREWAQDRCQPMTTYPANWRSFAKRAGPIRNQQMIDDGKPARGLVFPGGRGTADMRSRLVAHHIPFNDIAPPREPTNPPLTESTNG